jgi:hypothetical protein
VDSLFLIRNGVPFDVAFSLPVEDRTAWVIALGTLQGRRFDFEAMCWEQPP